MSNRFTHFKPGGYVSPTKKTLIVKNFVGVDFLNAKTNVNSQRGVYSNNYVMLDNKAQKRWSYDKIAYIPSTTYREISYETEAFYGLTKVSGNCFNGMWSFIADDGNRHFIAHIGNLLFEVTGIESERPTFTAILWYVGSMPNCSYTFKDEKSFAVAGNKRLWFLSGSSLVMVYYEKIGDSWYPKVEQVAFSDYAFVPTTSIGITYKNAKNSGMSGLDYPNILSAYRQNLLLSGVGKTIDAENDTRFYEYTLDGAIKWETYKEAKRMYDMEIEISYKGTMED